MSRRTSVKRKDRHKIEIHTEGETEKVYFEALRDYYKIRGGKGLKVKSYHKRGLDLFYYVKTLYKNHKFNTSPVSVVLVVDKDDTSDDELKELIKCCDKYGYTLLFSNMSFELWILLHYEEVNKNMDCSQLINRICKVSKTNKYKKADKKFLSKLVNKCPEAIKNSNKMSESIILNRNPYTNVGCFIKENFDI